MRECATMPMVCTADVLIMGAGMYLGTSGKGREISAASLVMYSGGGGDAGNMTYFILKLFFKLLKN
jgi:hypothetical protein